jgi:hypothetical protein
VVSSLPGLIDPCRKRWRKSPLCDCFSRIVSHLAPVQGSNIPFVWLALSKPEMSLTDPSLTKKQFVK